MATVAKPQQFRREDLKPGEVLCDHCTAKCCRYFALAMDVPKTRKDMDFVRWYVLHKQTTVFTENDTWYLLVHTDCMHLQSDNRCGIYHTRPGICREYSTDNCEFDDNYVYDRYFETPDQIADYMDAVFPDKTAGFRSPRPELLPILS